MLATLAAAALLSALPPSDSGIAVIPRPVSLIRGSGTFTLTGRTAIVVDRRTRALGHQLAGYLGPATGFRLAVREGAPAARAVVLRVTASLDSLGAEGYSPEITPRRVVAPRSTAAPALVKVLYLARLLVNLSD